MTLASLGFILARRRIGRRMLVVDRDRLHAISQLGENVDETIANARTITGLNLIGWQVARFTRLAEVVEHRTHQQGVVISRLILAAHAAAFTGLVVVVVFALALGGEDLASVAAALLYVEGAVRGLEALPPWIRDVQLRPPASAGSTTCSTCLTGSCCRPTHRARRLDAPAGLALEGVTARLSTGVSLTTASALLPPGTVVGLVTPAGTEPDEVLGLLSGDVNPAAGRVTLDGADVRTPALAQDLFYVPDEAEALSASLMDLLRAVAPDITTARAAELAEAVSLDHIVTLPQGVEERLGPGGAALTRQRAPATDACGRDRRRATRPARRITPRARRRRQRRPAHRRPSAGGQESTVISVRSGEVAEAVDLILFVSDGSARVGTHQQLLVDVPEYAQLWEQRLTTADVDLSVVGIDDADKDRMLARLVTEHYSPGDLIYRQGSPADRILFIISGHVEITTSSDHGGTKRVAVLGPGNHCGDLRLTAGEVRAENALALDDCVVRSLSRQAITAGLTGLLDRSAVERRIIESLLRGGSATRRTCASGCPASTSPTFASSIALLPRTAHPDDHGVVSAVLQRSAKTGAATCSTGWATCSPSGFAPGGTVAPVKRRSGMAIDVGADASPSASAAAPPPTSYPRFLGLRIQLRWKLLAAFAGAFTVVFVFLAIWIFQYTTATAMARLETQLEAAAVGGAQTLDAADFEELITTVPAVPDPTQPDWSWLSGQSALRVHRAGPAGHLHDHHRRESVHLLRGPCRRQPLLRGLRAATCSIPQIGVTYRVPVDQIVGPATYDRMEQGLTTTTNEPAYTDDFGSWISTYSPILAEDGQSVGRHRSGLPTDVRGLRPGGRSEAAVPGAWHQLRRAARARPRPVDVLDATAEATDRGDRAHCRRGVRPRRSGDGAHAVPRRDVHARRVRLHDGRQGRCS